MTELEPTQGAPVPASAETAGSLTDLSGPSETPLEQVVPTAAPPAPARPKGLLRWGVALIVVALLVGVGSVGAAMLAGSGSTSTLTGWVPTSAIGYAEIRADLPGDQKTKVGALLARFPGFKDQATLDQKLDEALDRMAQKSDVSFSRDIKPWMTGEIAIVYTTGMFDAAKAMQPAIMSGGGDVKAITEGYAMIAGVRDPAAAEAFLRAKSGSIPAATTYNGFSLTTMSDSRASLSFATGNKLLIVGLTDTVKAIIDTKGASEFSKSSSYSEARKVAPSSYLAFTYMDMKAVWSAMQTLYTDGSAAMPDTLGIDQAAVMACAMKASGSAMPAWMAGFVQAKDDNVWLEARSPEVKMDGAPVAANGTLAKHLPAGTVVAFTARDLGSVVNKTWEQAKEIYGCDAKLKEQLAQVDQALGMVGGLDGLVGWAGDSAIVVTANGSSMGGGVASVATDAAAAKKAFTQVQNLIALAGASAGVSTNASQYAGGDLISLVLPEEAGVPAIALAIRDDLVVIGTEDFVKATLDAKDDTGLTAQARYKRAVGLLGDKATLQYWIDITGIRATVEAQMPSATKAKYEADMKPFLEGIESTFGSGGAVENGQQVIRATVIFK